MPICGNSKCAVKCNDPRGGGGARSQRAPASRQRRVPPLPHRTHLSRRGRCSRAPRAKGDGPWHLHHTSRRAGALPWRMRIPAVFSTDASGAAAAAVQALRHAGSAAIPFGAAPQGELTACTARHGRPATRRHPRRCFGYSCEGDLLPPVGVPVVLEAEWRHHGRQRCQQCAGLGLRGAQRDFGIGHTRPSRATTAPPSRRGCTSSH